MTNCTICKKEFPEQVLKDMVHLMERKAFLELVCPACQMVALQNKDYYYLSNKKTGEPRIKYRDIEYYDKDHFSIVGHYVYYSQ